MLPFQVSFLIQKNQKIALKSNNWVLLGPKQPVFASKNAKKRSFLIEKGVFFD